MQAEKLSDGPRPVPAVRDGPRPVPAVRVWRTGIRTIHLIAVAALYGGHIHGVEAERLVPALVATVASGAAFVLLEVVHDRVWLVQVRGVATFAKLALIAAVAVLWEWRVVLLTLALVIGAVASHMPGRWRYHSLLHGRVVGSQGQG